MKRFILLFAALVLFLIHVWPTRYEYYRRGEGPRDEHVHLHDSTRVDRITGDIQVFQKSGEWRTVGNKRTALAFERPDVNPNAVGRPYRPTERRSVEQQAQSIENTQKAVDNATKQGAN